jgi:hypothetical protein
MSHDTRSWRRLGAALLFGVCLAAFTAPALSAVDAGASATSSAEPPVQGAKCKKCKGTGTLECKEHPRSDRGLEGNVLYCSHVDGCEPCGGTGLLSCPKCEREDVDTELAARRAEYILARERLAVLDEEMGRPLPKAESEHFVLVWDIESMKVGKRRLDAHQLLHLYVDRLEELFDQYCEVLGASPDEFERKSRIFVWGLEGDQREGSLRFCTMGQPGPVKLMGQHPTYSVCGAKGFFDTEEQLHRHVIHSVTHLLLSHQEPQGWIGNLKGGWADAGLAHWMEYERWELCDVYCYQEQDVPSDFRGGRWKPKVRKLVATGKAPSAAGVFVQNVDTLSGLQHAVSLSFVDYLLELDGERFSQLVKQLKAKVPTRDALKEVFGLSVLEFERDWQAWVLETYPTK